MSRRSTQFPGEPQRKGQGAHQSGSGRLTGAEGDGGEAAVGGGADGEDHAQLRRGVRALGRGCGIPIPVRVAIRVGESERVGVVRRWQACLLGRVVRAARGGDEGRVGCEVVPQQVQQLVVGEVVDRERALHPVGRAVVDVASDRAGVQHERVEGRAVQPGTDVLGELRDRLQARQIQRRGVDARDVDRCAVNRWRHAASAEKEAGMWCDLLYRQRTETRCATGHDDGSHENLPSWRHLLRYARIVIKQGVRCRREGWPSEESEHRRDRPRGGA